MFSCGVRCLLCAITVFLLCLLIVCGAAGAAAHAQSDAAPPFTISISAVGDCTFGGDPRKGTKEAFDRYFKKQDSDYGYYFKNVASVFAEDDLTIANLEGALTERKKFRKGEIFVFRGNPSYAKILTEGGIDAVNLANNHAIDFLAGGVKDTQTALDEEGIAHFGFKETAVIEAKGVKIGLCGFTTWRSSAKQVKSVISELKKECDLVIASFHWGEEGVGKARAKQIKMAHFAIDNGADLVLGHHPHVVGGLETYQGKRIVYSLANFSFGGNRNLDDRDTFIFRQRFTVNGREITDAGYEIIPCLSSGTKSGNNYQPVLATGSDADRIDKRIGKLSR